MIPVVLQYEFRKKRKKEKKDNRKQTEQEVLNTPSFIGISFCLSKPNVVSEVNMVFHFSAKHFNNELMSLKDSLLVGVKV